MNRPTVLASVALAALAAGCRGQTSDEPPIALLRNMHFQQRFDSQSENTFFADRRAMRPEVEGTVSRESYAAGTYLANDTVALGLNPDGTGYVPTIPDDVVNDFGGMQPLVDRGANRYAIYCTPCHGRTGDGNGIIRTRAAVSGYVYNFPPTYHDDRIRHMPDGQLYATITNGKSNMPPYASQIPVRDRWAIVGYVRALQISQAAVPPPAPTAPAPASAGAAPAPAPAPAAVTPPAGAAR